LTDNKKITITKELKEQMLEHAREELPYEACGVISGDADKGPVYFYPARNELKSSTRYHIDPYDLYRIIMDIEEEGHEIWGIFHSHPASAAYPSDTDLEQSYYPDAYYLIASFADVKKPVLRAFRIVDKQVEEIEVLIE